MIHEIVNQSLIFQTDEQTDTVRFILIPKEIIKTTEENPKQTGIRNLMTVKLTFLTKNNVIKVGVVKQFYEFDDWKLTYTLVLLTEH